MPGLSLLVTEGNCIKIGPDIEVAIKGARHGKVQLKVLAPRELHVDRCVGSLQLTGRPPVRVPPSKGGAQG